MDRLWERKSVVLALLAAGFLLRLWTAHAYWGWFDREFPGTWERSRAVLSQDGTQYLQQADPDTWQRQYRGAWQDHPYYRPPLASFFFAALARAAGFDRIMLSSVEASAVGGASGRERRSAQGAAGVGCGWGPGLPALCGERRNGFMGIGVPPGGKGVG